MTFIKELSERRSNYAHPDQATTQAKSLDQLSSGIYTEDERFIYELLQNAVDSFNSKNNLLDIKIVAQEGYLVFMHNGEAFSQRDVEGLCDVGNGNKMKDIQKIGYKGIGFKSVFRASNCVYIKSGDYCFKFDKAVWNNYWDSNWKNEYGEKDPDKNYLMPWQIIPIETTTPIQIDTTGYNVVTYIQTKNLAELSESVKTLLRTSQFLLFLTAKNVRMTYVESGVPQQIIEKQTFDNEISLLVNGKEESRWLYHMIPNVPINDEELRLRIAEDQKTPDKLKIDEHGKTLSVNTFDIAFAVQIENKDGERIVKTADNPVMYTYLPTSFKFGDEGFPFLVNANFITDAGREQLIKDSEWNKLLISKIPELYLKWVATFSREIKNYYDVLPKKSYGVSDKLRLAYDTAAKSAIETIPFIPSLRTNELLKSNDAFIDRIGLADIMKHQLLFAHIDRIYNRTFEQESNIVANQGVTILKQYGVFVFDQSKFKAFFDDKEAINGISSDEDVKLIKLLHECCLLNEDSDFEQQLQEIPFLLNNHNQLALPCQLCTHVLEDADEINADVQTINADIYNQLSQYDLDWLKKLGLSEPSDTSIIDTGRLFEEGVVTRDNAIEVCYYIYSLYKKGCLDEKQCDQLGELKVLTKNGSMICAKDAYLSNEYYPKLNIEPFYEKDWYISPDYILNMLQIDIDMFVAFLCRIGVSQNAVPETHQIHLLRENSNPSRREYCVQMINELSRENPNEWAWERAYTDFYAIRLLDEAVDNYAFARLVWKNIFDNTNVDTNRLMQKFTIWKFYGWEKQSYTTWLLDHKKILPTTLQTVESKDVVYNNNIPHIMEIASDVLPILDYNGPLSNEWDHILNLKNSINFEDYFMLLSDYSKREKFDNQDIRRRINIIYGALINLLPFFNAQQIAYVKDWANTNCILTQDGKFCSPVELAYTTLEGFTSKHQVYTGKIEDKDKLVELLKLFGVKIYTEENIDVQISGEQIDALIQPRLLSALPVLALLASDDHNEAYFKTKCADLQSLIENNTFCSCDSIKLVFRDATGEADRLTYATKDHFYYTGKLTASKMEPLLSPLCALLGIKGKERELFVIMVENDYDAILEFLREKDYKVQWISAVSYTPAPNAYGSAQIGGVILNAPPTEQQIAENNEAKTLVLDRLAYMGCDVANAEESYSLINGVRYNGEEYPVVVKSCKNYKHSMHLNPSEWQQLLRPNSMLWAHLGNREIVPIQAFELFTYQDRLTLSFGSVNLLKDDRLHKIMHVLRYFNDVHLDIASMNPKNNRSENLNAILFNNNIHDKSDLGENKDINF